MQNEKTPFMLFPSVESRVIAGTLSFIGMIIVLAWVAINENSRMEEFTARFEGRSIETGAILFESNCSECHGQLGYGLAGVAPALNNPNLFGYNFFADIDQQITARTTELENVGASDPERAARLEAEIATLEAEKVVLRERLLYDYGPELDAAQEQLLALDTEVVDRFGEEYGFDSGQRFVRTATELSNQIAALESEQELIQTRVDAATLAEEEPAEEDLARLDEIATELEVLNERYDPLETYFNQRTDLVAKIGRFTALDDAHQQVMALREELAMVEGQLAALPPVPEDEDAEDPAADERAALTEQKVALESDIAAKEIEREDARDALIDAGDIVPYDPDQPPRTEQLDWSAGVRDLIRTTLIGGRPTAGYWPNRMQAWAQEGGGPLRMDEIENLVDYIMNWDREFTVEDVRAIRQYPIVPSLGGGESDLPSVGTDVEAILMELDTLEAEEDPEQTVFDSNVGQELYNSIDWGCAGCHMSDGTGTGPSPLGVAERAQEYADADPAITSARYYLVQSIVAPNTFVVEGYSSGVMPANFGDRMDIYTLSNMIAYLESLD